MPHVVHNRARLTFEGAKAVLAAAEQRALELGVPVIIAVVDDGGHLAAFSRMDGARISSARFAIAKAHASAIQRQATGPAKNDASSVLMSLSLAITSRAHVTPMRGGVPLEAKGQCVGAIGVSNGTEDEDVDVARAGAAALNGA